MDSIEIFYVTGSSIQEPNLRKKHDGAHYIGPNYSLSAEKGSVGVHLDEDQIRFRRKR